MNSSTERAFSQGFRHSRRQANSPPPLTPFEQYRAKPTPRLKAKLVEANWGLVQKAARRWSKLCDTPFDDLCQEGAFGLLKAIEGFDPGQGNAFSSFAMPKIHGEIQHYLRDKGWGVIRVPQQAAYEYSRVKGAQRKLIAAGRDDLSEEEIAVGIGLTPERWRFVKEVREAPQPASLTDGPIEVEATADEEDLSWVYGYVEALPDPQGRCVIEYVFGTLKDSSKKVEAIAKRHGLTSAATQQLIDSALAKMRNQIQEDQGYGS
ncbi:MAG: sigma-70 family RNA polymerase sigma factor [Cyanobacteria bacterium P01_C01_bin.69]